MGVVVSHLLCLVVGDAQVSAAALNTAPESRGAGTHFPCCYEPRHKMRFICNSLIEKTESWGLMSQKAFQVSQELLQDVSHRIGRGQRRKKLAPDTFCGHC